MDQINPGFGACALSFKDGVLFFRLSIALEEFQQQNGQFCQALPLVLVLHLHLVYFSTNISGFGIVFAVDLLQN